MIQSDSNQLLTATPLIGIQKIESALAKEVTESYLIPLFDKIGLFSKHQQGSGGASRNFLQELRLSDRLLVQLQRYKSDLALIEVEP